MGAEALVSFDIENGGKVIDSLDHAGKSPNVALWAKLPDYEDWRLVIASEHLDQTSQFVQVTRKFMRFWIKRTFRLTDNQQSS